MMPSLLFLLGFAGSVRDHGYPGPLFSAAAAGVVVQWHLRQQATPPELAVIGGGAGSTPSPAPETAPGAGVFPAPS